MAINKKKETANNKVQSTKKIQKKNQNPDTCFEAVTMDYKE